MTPYVIYLIMLAVVSLIVGFFLGIASEYKMAAKEIERLEKEVDIQRKGWYVEYQESRRLRQVLSDIHRKSKP